MTARQTTVVDSLYGHMRISRMMGCRVGEDASPFQYCHDRQKWRSLLPVIKSCDQIAINFKMGNRTCRPTNKCRIAQQSIAQPRSQSGIPEMTAECAHRSLWLVGLPEQPSRQLLHTTVESSSEAADADVRCASTASRLLW